MHIHTYIYTYIGQKIAGAVLNNQCAFRESLCLHLFNSVTQTFVVGTVPLDRVCSTGLR